jgi:hypothetical protein
VRFFVTLVILRSKQYSTLTRLISLVAQIEALGQTEGLWPKGIYLNMKAEDLMKNVNAFAGEVEVYHHTSISSVCLISSSIDFISRPETTILSLCP